MLLNRTHLLENDACARLRLPHTGDRHGLIALMERLGLDLGEMDAGRLLRGDPRRDVMLCATVWTSDRNVLAGYAATGPHGPTVLADESLAPGITALLTEALAQRAARRVA